MAYSKTTWNAGAAPGISAANLNNLETQYDAAAADLSTHAGGDAKTKHAGVGSHTHQSSGPEGGKIKLDDWDTPDDNTDLNASINSHGLLPKLPNDANKFLLGNGTWGGLPLTTSYAASDTLKNSHDADTSWISQTWSVPTKAKEMKFNAVCVGTLRIKFDLRLGNSGTAYARIYKNGSAVGTLQSSTSNMTWVTKSEDLTVNMAVNDLLQIYTYTSGANIYAAIQNFRLYYSKKLVTLGGETLETVVLLNATAISITNQ